MGPKNMKKMGILVRVEWCILIQYRTVPIILKIINRCLAAAVSRPAAQRTRHYNTHPVRTSSPARRVLKTSHTVNKKMGNENKHTKNEKYFKKFNKNNEHVNKTHAFT
jgi:hypothetical protein